MIGRPEPGVCRPTRALLALGVACATFGLSGWHRGGTAAASLLLSGAAKGTATWRISPGTEESLLLRFPSASRAAPAAVSWSPSPPLAGCRVAGEVVRGSGDRALALVRLKVPAGARAGRYVGLLTVRCGAAVVRQPVAAEVLPFDLMRPSKQYSVSRVPVSAGEWRAPEQAGAAALRGLREIGVGSLCLDAAPADRSALEDAMRAAGLRGPVLAPVLAGTGEGATGPGTRAASGGDGATGPPASSSASSLRATPATIRWYSLYSGAPPAPGSMTGQRASGELVACRMEGAEPASGVDLPIYDAGGTDGARLNLPSGSLAPGTPGWWRWDAGRATPLENRLRCGALLWKSGLSGALVEIPPDAPADPDWPLRWEGVRQGVLDSRYLTTLISLIRQVKDKERSSRLPGAAEGAMAAALNGVQERPSPEAADRLRAVAIAWILRLGQVVWSG